MYQRGGIERVAAQCSHHEINAFYKIILNGVKDPALSPLFRAAPLNTDQGSTNSALSTVCCLLPDQKSLECVNLCA